MPTSNEWEGAGTGALGGAAKGAALGAPFGGVGAVVGAGVGAIAGGIMGFLGADAQDAEIARRKAETAEALRRMKLQQEAALGQGRAMAAASGVEFGTGSFHTYLTSMAAEYRRQAEWAQKSGTLTVDALESSYDWQRATDLAGSLFSAGQMAGIKPKTQAPTGGGSPLSFGPAPSSQFTSPMSASLGSPGPLKLNL